MHVFKFGARHTVPTRRGGTAVVGDYALHVQCAWRITGLEGIVVGSRDVYYPRGDPDVEPPGFEWDRIGANRRDERIDALLAKHEAEPLVVESVQGDAFGGARIILTKGYVLELFAHDSLPDEYWRLFVPDGEGSPPHFVVTGEGIE